MPRNNDYVTIIVSQEPLNGLADEIADGLGRIDGTSIWFEDNLAIPADAEPGEAALYVQHCTHDLLAASVFAPNCADFDEVERRVMRHFGVSAIIDDCQIAVEL